MRRIFGIICIVAFIAVVVPHGVHGQAATTHSVTLTWNPSTSSPVTSEIVYRAATVNGPWTVLATLSGNTINTYTDATVANGQTYVYEVDAEDGTVLSGPSNSVTEAIPSGVNLLQRG